MRKEEFEALVEKLWRDAGLPEYFLGNGGTNHKLYEFAKLIRQDFAEQPKPDAGVVKEPDYKRLAYEFAELLGFCMDNLRPSGTGLVLDQNSGKTEPWRNWIARYVEKLPDMTIDRDALEALDLPAKARRKRLAEIAAAKAKPTDDEPKVVEPTITVCSACLQASCWQGAFYCDDYKSAGTVEKTRSELEKLNLEHPDYWQEPKAGAQ